MFRKSIAIIISIILWTPFTVYAVSGFDETVGGITETKNEYFFETSEACLIWNNELFTDPDYDEVYPGSNVYIPVYVYPDGGKDSIIATDKMIKTDNVAISGKAMLGGQNIGEITLVDGKKLKKSGLPAGIYAQIPFTADYERLGKTSVSVRLVLDVNGVSYQSTRITLNCKIVNRVVEINDNSVYGAKTPTQFRVRKNYSGEATFDFGDNIKYTARVRSDAKYYLNLSRNPDDSIAGMYPDAYLEFYDFLGDEKTFASGGKLEIPVKRDKLAKKDEPASLFVYRIDDGALTSLDSDEVSFNPASNKLTIYTKTLGSYVLSNRALMREVDRDDENILKSGYASAAEPEITEASSGASASGSSAAAPPPSSSAPDQAIQSSQAADDGYPPGDAWDNQNQNVSTGLPINAANKSSDNPSTADASPFSPVIAGLFGLIVPTLAVCYGGKKHLRN